MTGKPLSQGGIAGRTEATGLGLFFATREFLDNEGFAAKHGLARGIKGKTVVVQGFGNVGFYAAKFLAEMGGAKIVGVVEYNSAVFNPAGLDVEALKKHQNEKKTLLGFAGATRELGAADALSGIETACDILVPAALEKQITKHNAAKIKAKVIAEGANGPVTPWAEEILAKNGTVVLPDILCNAGGVTCSYYEWLKNLSHVRFGRLTRRWEERSKTLMLNEIEAGTGRKIAGAAKQAVIAGPTERDIVYSGLEDTMSIGVAETIATANAKGVSYRIAAFVNAINKVGVCYADAGLTV